LRTVRLKPFHPFRSGKEQSLYLAHYDELAERSALTWDVSMLNTAHGRTLVRVTGPHDAPPLVLLPPRTGHSLNSWGSIIDLVSTNYRVHAVDSIYDFGRSVNAGPASGVADYTQWLGEVFDALDLVSDVNVIGFSRGAWMSAEYLLHAPERLRKVVWLSPGALLLPYSLRKTPSAVLGLPMLIAPSAFTVRLGTRSTMAGAASSGGPAGEEYERFVAEMALGMRCFDLKNLDFYRIERVLTDDELHGMRVPVLYLAGEREKMYSAREGAARLASVAPQIERCLIPDAGHDLVALRPDVVADRIVRFLA
jgi:pimeloyl-ACP methyl ester carboxylesterase